MSQNHPPSAARTLTPPLTDSQLVSPPSPKPPSPMPIPISTPTLARYPNYSPPSQQPDSLSSFPPPIPDSQHAILPVRTPSATTTTTDDMCGPVSVQPATPQHYLVNGVTGMMAGGSLRIDNNSNNPASPARSMGGDFGGSSGGSGSNVAAASVGVAAFNGSGGLSSSFSLQHPLSMSAPGFGPGYLSGMLGTSVGSASPRMQTPTSVLAENAVGVREVAKNIGRTLLKLERPQTVMLVAKAFDVKVIQFTRHLACHLIDTRKSCTDGLTCYIDEKLRNHPAFNYNRLISLHPHYAHKLQFWTPEFCARQADKIDFIITLGGDGTVLYTSWLFQTTQVPPVVPFHLGSLGFLGNFNILDMKDVLERVIGQGGEGVRVNMRMRLSCTVWRCGSGRGRRESRGGVGHKRKESTGSAGYGRNPNSLGGPGNIGMGGPVPLRHNRSPFNSNSNLFDMNPMLATGKDDDEITIPGSPGARLHPASHQLDIGDLLAKVSTQLTCEADDEPEPIPHRKPSAGSRSPTSPLRPLSVGSAPSLLASKPVAAETFQILNDLVVDRGPSAYMSQLELFVDDRHLTTVQADGLVLSTPTGSTAYSLSAGGSLVHPEVPSFLVTPICPHTLSFRPMLLPDSIELKIQVPADSRSTAWASFDGRHRIELKQGDYITVGLSRWPMPTVCEADQSSDWFESLRRCLHWNERTRQKGFDPMSSAPLSPSTNVLINPISRFQMEAEGEHHKAVFGIGSDGGMESPEDELGGAGDEDFLVREMGMG